MTSHMELVPTLNAAILVAMTILLALLHPFVASQAEVGTEPRTPFRHRVLGIGHISTEEDLP